MTTSSGKMDTQKDVCTSRPSPMLINLVSKTVKSMKDLCKGKEEREYARKCSFRSMRLRVDEEEAKAWLAQRRKEDTSASDIQAQASRK